MSQKIDCVNELIGASDINPIHQAILNFIEAVKIMAKYYKGTLDIPIDLIKNHPVFSDHEPLNYLLKNSNQSFKFPPSALKHIFELHPIKVMSASKGDYFCIGGMRTLSLARHCMRGEAIVSVIYVTGLSTAEITEHCYLDIALPAICFTTFSKDVLSNFLEKLPAEIASKISQKSLGSSTIAQLLGVSRETVRKWMKKNQKTS